MYNGLYIILNCISFAYISIMLQLILYHYSILLIVVNTLIKSIKITNIIKLIMHNVSCIFIAHSLTTLPSEFSLKLN